MIKLKMLKDKIKNYDDLNIDSALLFHQKTYTKELELQIALKNDISLALEIM